MKLGLFPLPRYRSALALYKEPHKVMSNNEADQLVWRERDILRASLHADCHALQVRTSSLVLSSRLD